MAMLEAFVYDPLISWKLLGTIGDKTTTVDGGGGGDTTPPITTPPTTTVTDEDIGLGIGDTLGAVIESDDNNTTILGIDGIESVLSTAKSMEASFNIPGIPVPSLSSGRSGGDIGSGGSGSGGDIDEPLEELNSRALEVINRIQAKLTGRDFDTIKHLE